MEANEPAYVLATSGTTAKPKLVVHSHGGYQVGIHSMGDWCFGLKPDDVWWSTSDIGWASATATSSTRRSWPAAPRSPTRGRSTIPAPRPSTASSPSNGVTGIFTAPTAVRMLMALWHRAGPGVTISRFGRTGGLRRRAAQRPRLGVAADARSSPTGCRSSTTCGRPRPAAPSSATPMASSLLPDQARVGRHPLARHLRRGPHPGGRAMRTGREGDRRPHPPLPVPHPDDLGRPGALRPRLLAAYPRRLLHRRRRLGRRGRLLLVQRPRRRDHQDRRAPHRHRSRSRRPSCAIRRWPRPASAADPTSCAARWSPPSSSCAPATSRRRS